MVEPHVDITWQALAAIAAVIAVICGGGALYVQYAIKSAIADLFDRLNGRYVRSDLAKERHDDVLRRLDAIDAELGR